MREISKYRRRSPRSDRSQPVEAEEERGRLASFRKEQAADRADRPYFLPRFCEVYPGTGRLTGRLTDSPPRFPNGDLTSRHIPNPYQSWPEFWSAFDRDLKRFGRNVC